MQLFYEQFSFVINCHIVVGDGSSGGLGVNPGTLVITKTALSPLLEPFYTLVECGKERKLHAEPDSKLNQDLVNAAKLLG